MKFSPGPWAERLIEATQAESGLRPLRDYGEDTIMEVMSVAQKWISRFTVVICTTGTTQNSKLARDITPGSGVVVQLGNNTFGVLTAGHVLKRGDNTNDNVSVTVLALPRHQRQGGDAMGIGLQPRPCTVVGFDNRREEGPDIAIIPLESEEMSALDSWGVIAYNLDRRRWSDEDVARVRETNPCLCAIINGVRCKASEIVYGHTDGTHGSLVTMATNTRVDDAQEKDGWDYLELPSETTEHSFPTRWKEPLPGTAAQEIRELHEHGVTKQAWGGTSGAGVWNLAIGTTQTGQPDGTVLGELAGVCFYASPDKGCIIAHGKSSIAKIATSHIEREALRYHNML